MWFIKRQDYVGKFMRKAKDFGLFESKEYEKLVEYLKGNSKSVKQGQLGLKLIVISDTHGDLAFSVCL